MTHYMKMEMQNYLSEIRATQVLDETNKDLEDSRSRKS